MSLAFIFPGQGSQKLGMLEDFSIYDSVIRDHFHRASDILGLDLYAIAKEGPESELNKTELTQPILLTLSTALWSVYANSGRDLPAFLAGHSLGEYSALVAGGAMRFEDAVRLVHLRGQLMQKAVPAGQGLMAAVIGLSDEDVIASCESVGGVVSAANFNSPGQVVIAGEAQAVNAAIEACKTAGARLAKVLPVSIPSHCALMKSAADELALAIDTMTITMPTIPVVQNVNADVAHDVDELKALLLAQLYSPVRWTDSVNTLIQHGVTECIECGPQKVLCGLGKRINRDVVFTPFE